MKFIKLAGASVGILIIVGVALSAASLAAFGSAGSDFSGSLSTGEVASLVSQGIPRSRANQSLSLQRDVSQTHLVSRVASALARTYAGVWFDPAAARFHIGVTSDAGRRAAERVVDRAKMTAVVTYTPVRSTWSALLLAQSQWTARLASLIAAGLATTGIDTTRNAVSVTLSSSLPPAQRTGLTRQAAAAEVNVLVSVEPPSMLHFQREATCEAPFTTLRPYCEKTLVAGVGIKTPVLLCTAGPMLIAGNETYMLTAGHCLGIATILGTGEIFTSLVVTSEYQAGGGQLEIGREGKRYNNKERDMAEIKLKRSAPTSLFLQASPTPLPALVTEWTALVTAPHAVNGVEAAVVGQTVCHQGRTTGEQCGTILRLNVEVAETDHLVETNACSEAGDSGGPYFYRTGLGEVLMEGVHIGKMGGGCPRGPTSRTGFEPLLDGPGTALGFGILSTFPGQELLTTANETRRVRGPFFNIKGARLLAGEKKAFEGKVSKEFLLTAGTIKVACTKQKPEKAFLVGSTAANPGSSEESIVFEGCTISGDGEKCEVEGGKLKTEPVLETLAYEKETATKGEKILTYLKAAKGAALAKAKFSGTCTTSETTVEGTVAGELLRGGVGIKVEEEPAEAEANEVTFPKTALATAFTEKEGKREKQSPSLTAFGKSATLAGTTEVKLASKEKWGVFTR